jgi:hypothetical protein
MANGEQQEFLAAVAQSLTEGDFVKLSLGHYMGPEEGLKTIHIRKTLIKKEIKLGFTYRYKTRDIAKNYAPEDGLGRIRRALGAEFQTATLFTTGFDLVLEQVRGRKPMLQKKEPTHTNPVALDHDRQKNRLIAASGKFYLQALNIADESGKILKTAQDKYRQINKYVEILSVLIRDIPPERLTNIVDMGAGKGYLTFALYDYLTGTLNLKPRVTGVEYRADLVDLCNRVAAESGFEGLHFIQGTIENYDSTRAHILIALHACDTATDDAIAKGIVAGAGLIVVAPCCHKQIRREIEKHKVHNDLDFLMKYGIFIERQAEMVTDGLRALILEYFGYTTKIFEFISDAHTPKNVLIVGIKDPHARRQDPAILARIAEIKAYFGIECHYLERATGIRA